MTGTIIPVLRLASVGQEVQKWERGKSLYDCRGRVPNPGQASGLGGMKKDILASRPNEIYESNKSIIRDSRHHNGAVGRNSTGWIQLLHYKRGLRRYPA